MGREYEEFAAYMVNYHTGRKNGIKRVDLVQRFGRDRVNRNTFLQMWKDGYFVINDMRGDGYYIPDFNDPEDIRRFGRYMEVRGGAVETEAEKLKFGNLKLAELALKIITEGNHGQDEQK